QVDDDVEHGDDFAWLTLGQIHALMKRPNVVNMDTRTVLSCLPLPAAEDAGERIGTGPPGSSAADPGGPRTGLSRWLAGRTAHHQLSTALVPLSCLPDWRQSGEEIWHRTGKYFKIIGVEVAATNREVRTWCQPLLEPCGDGLAAFVIQRGADGLRVLAHADVRPGYRNAVEIGPTVQCTPLNFADIPERRPAFLDLVLSEDVLVRYDVPQSEEGGRFHHAVTRHLVVEVDGDDPLPVPPDYFWITLRDLSDRIRGGFEVNIEARSLFACLQASC
ncbi:MAG TPA: NDP-hexose 2,3-dehydratase family protein, partial [Jatrophihabitans sp.]|nr:NDP-hexose 2,3-dehydratase family protein [Jatrophihabitans sp.]